MLIVENGGSCIIPKTDMGRLAASTYRPLWQIKHGAWHGALSVRLTIFTRVLRPTTLTRHGSAENGVCVPTSNSEDLIWSGYA